MYYEDFTLRLEAKEDGSYTVHAKSILEEEHTSPFCSPASLDEILEMATELKHIVTVSRGEPSRDLQGQQYSQVIEDRAQKIGHLLYQGLFSGAVQGLFERRLGHIGLDPRRGLRIKLQLPVDQERSPLNSLPWETL